MATKVAVKQNIGDKYYMTKADELDECEEPDFTIYNKSEFHNHHVIQRQLNMSESQIDHNNQIDIEPLDEKNNDDEIEKQNEEGSEVITAHDQNKELDEENEEQLRDFLKKSKEFSSKNSKSKEFKNLNKKLNPDLENQEYENSEMDGSFDKKLIDNYTQEQLDFLVKSEAKIEEDRVKFEEGDGKTGQIKRKNPKQPYLLKDIEMENGTQIYNTPKSCLQYDYYTFSTNWDDEGSICINLDLNIDVEKLNPEQTRYKVRQQLQHFKSLEETISFSGNNTYEWRRTEDDFEICIYRPIHTDTLLGTLMYIMVVTIVVPLPLIFVFNQQYYMMYYYLVVAIVVLTCLIILMQYFGDGRYYKLLFVQYGFHDIDCYYYDNYGSMQLHVRDLKKVQRKTLQLYNENDSITKIDYLMMYTKDGPYLTFPFGEENNDNFDAMCKELNAFVCYYKEHQENYYV